MPRPSQWLQDVRFALRLLARNRRHALVVTLTLGLGIAVSSATFSVVDAVLLRPLPYPDSPSLTWIADFDEYFQQDTWGSRADYLVWRDQSNSFSQMTAYGNLDLPLVADGEASQERIASITGDFWSMVGATPELGRLFAPDETGQIVLTHALATRRFGGAESLVGRSIEVEGRLFTICGILPPSFRFLFPQQMSSVDERREIDAYIPLPPAAEQPGQPVARGRGPAPGWISVVGRLRSGVSLDQAKAEMQTIHAALGRDFPHPLRHERLTVIPLEKKVAGGVRRALLVLFGAAGFILLIAAANIANLTLAQASRREKELAIRTTMGARPLRLARQILTENAILAGLAAAAGLALGNWLLAIVVSLGAAAAPRLEHAVIDFRVIAFALGAAILTAALVSAAMLAARGGELGRTLASDARSFSVGGRVQRFRGVLVAAELAMALILLTGAGLMLESLWRMNQRPPGFAPQNILSMRIPLSSPRYESWPAQDAYIRELLRRLRQTPGVDAAGIDVGALNTEVGLADLADETTFAAVRMVSQGYLEAMGVGLTRGRWPQAHEELDAVLVNQTFARRFGPGMDPVGRRIRGSFLRGTIVGVVADFKHTQLDAEPSAEVYYPYQFAPVIHSLHVLLATRDPAATAPAVRETISEIDRTQPVYRFGSLDELLADSIAPRRFNLALLGVFSVTALLLALVGVYGLTAFVVERRTREVGIRIALGAAPSEVVVMILRHGLGVAFSGGAAGLCGGFLLTRWMQSMLYGVDAHDPKIFAAVATGLLAAATLACLGPALKAARVDPMESLRHD